MVKITDLNPPPLPLDGSEGVPVVQGDGMYLADLADVTEQQVARAAAWAEGTLPGGAGTKSAKEWAGEAAATASGIAALEIVITRTEADILDVVTRSQLSDPSAYTDGYFVNATGGLNASANYAASEWIAWPKGVTQVTMSRGNWLVQGALSAGTITAVSGTNANPDSNTYTLTKHADATHFRVSVLKSAFPVADFSITPGATLTFPKPAFVQTVSGTVLKDNTVDGAALTDGSVTPAKASFLEPGKNLFDKTATTLDTVQSTAGPATLVGYQLSDYIPITPGTTYTYSAARFRSVFDSNGVNRGAPYSTTTNGTTSYTAVSGDAFLRLTYLDASVDTAQVEVGSVATAYEPFGYRLTDDIISNGVDIVTTDRLEGPIDPRVNTLWPNRDDNLFDWQAALVQDGKFQGATGVAAANATYFISDFIAVTPGQTYSWGFGERGARTVTAYDATGAAVAASGSDVQVTSWTCPTGITAIKFTTWATAAKAGVVKMTAGASVGPMQPWGFALDETFLPYLADLPATEGLSRMRHCTLFRARREDAQAARLSVMLIGDSFTDAYDRYVKKLLDRIVATYGDGGGGWTGYGFNSGAGPFVIGGTQPGGVHGNPRPVSYTLAYDGAWAGPAYFTGTPSPDLGLIQSSTAGAFVRRTVPAAPDHTALRLVWVGTADGVIRYQVDGGSWTSANTQGTVGAIGYTDIPLTPGAHTVNIEVVSGTVKLCGDIAVSAASGVVFHKLGISGGRIDAFAAADATQHHAALTLLTPDVGIIFEGTNSQGNGTAGNYFNWTTSLTTFVNRVRSAGANPDILLVAPPENGLGRINPMSDYAMQMRLLSRTIKTAFLDMQRSFGEQYSDYDDTGTWPLFQSDNTHPNPVTGGYIMALEIRRAMGLA